MTTHLTRSIKTPIREDVSTAADIWDGPDKGLIYCWELGRKERKEKPDLAARAESGELVAVGRLRANFVNDFRDDELPDDAKTDVDESAEGAKTRKKRPENHGIWKRGSLQYLAWWQGLRGESLDVSLVQTIEIVCPKIFTTEKGKKGQRKYYFPRRKKPSAFDDVPVTE
jgi:hypothetical protein